MCFHFHYANRIYHMYKAIINITVFIFLLLAIVPSTWIADHILVRLGANSAALYDEAKFYSSDIEVAEEISVPGKNQKYEIICTHLKLTGESRKELLEANSAISASEAEAALGRIESGSGAYEPDWMKFRCEVLRKAAVDELVAWFHFGETSEGVLGECDANTKFKMSHSIWPHRSLIENSAIEGKPAIERKFGYLKNVQMLKGEQVREEWQIGSIDTLCALNFFKASQISFNLEQPSVEALIAGVITKSTSYIDEELALSTGRRLASEITRVIDANSGLFAIRDLSNTENNPFRLLFSGFFEYAILILGVFAFIVSVGAVIVGVLSAEVSKNLGRLSVRITGLLTYMGLLGTLFGVFMAINGLSGIDFLDEFKKAFDQTASFGAMSLAVGTSVVGLSCAVVVGLLQSSVASVGGLIFGLETDPFE